MEGGDDGMEVKVWIERTEGEGGEEEMGGEGEEE
jgi:hypothetical protein